MNLVIAADGIVRCLYDEAIDLKSIGAVTIRRASHVEPTTGGQWIVDLSPVRGPRLGPFRRRSEALAAEEDWLTRHRLLPAVR